MWSLGGYFHHGAGNGAGRPALRLEYPQQASYGDALL